MRSSRWHQSTLVTEPQSGSGSKVCISLCIIHLFCCMSSHFPWRSILFSPSVSNKNFWLNYYFGTGHGYQQLPRSSVSHSCTIPKKPFRNDIANAELQIKAQREHACLSTSINNRGYELAYASLLNDAFDGLISGHFLVAICTCCRWWKIISHAAQDPKSHCVFSHGYKQRNNHTCVVTYNRECSLIARCRQKVWNLASMLGKARQL